MMYPHSRGKRCTNNEIDVRRDWTETHLERVFYSCDRINTRDWPAHISGFKIAKLFSQPRCLWTHEQIKEMCVQNGACSHKEDAVRTMAASGEHHTVVKSVGFRDSVSCFLPYKIIYTGHERREDWGDEREEWESRGWGVNVATVLVLSTAFEAHHYVQWVRDNKIHWKRKKKKKPSEAEIRKWGSLWKLSGTVDSKPAPAPFLRGTWAPTGQEACEFVLAEK